MIFAIIMAVFGIALLIKGEFKVTNNRLVKGSVARILGGLTLLSVPLLLLYGEPFCTGTFILVVVIGLLTAEKIN
jgi:hypothetical protein